MRHWNRTPFHLYAVEVPLTGAYDLKEIADWDSFHIIRDLRIITANRLTSLSEGFTDMAGVQITSDCGMFSMLNFDEAGNFRRNTVVDGLVHFGAIRIEWFCQEPANGVSATLKLLRATAY